MRRLWQWRPLGLTTVMGRAMVRRSLQFVSSPLSTPTLSSSSTLVLQRDVWANVVPCGFGKALNEFLCLVSHWGYLTAFLLSRSTRIHGNSPYIAVLSPASVWHVLCCCPL